MSYDEIWRMPYGGYAFVRLGGRPKQCSICGQRATLQCDFPKTRGKTCDKWLCRGCGIMVGPDRDFCPDHSTGQKELNL